MQTELKTVKAVPFWGFWAEGPTTEMPDGTIGATAVGCENLRCSTGCPGVALTFVVQGHRYEIRMDTDDAIIIEQANAASGTKPN